MFPPGAMPTALRGHAFPRKDRIAIPCNHMATQSSDHATPPRSYNHVRDRNRLNKGGQAAGAPDGRVLLGGVPLLDRCGEMTHLIAGKPIPAVLKQCEVGWNRHRVRLGSPPVPQMFGRYWQSRSARRPIRPARTAWSPPDDVFSSHRSPLPGSDQAVAHSIHLLGPARAPGGTHGLPPVGFDARAGHGFLELPTPCCIRSLRSSRWFS